MRFAIVIFSALILLLLAGVLPVGKGLSATAVYTSPIMILLLALLSVASIKCCLKRRPLGFILVHLGVVIILGGAFAGYLAGTKGNIQLQLRRPASVGGLAGAKPVSFGFEVAARDFQVEFYPPVYKLFRPLPPEEILPGQMPFAQAGELDANGTEQWMISGHTFAVSNLWTRASHEGAAMTEGNGNNGEWVERYRLDDGTVLFRGPQTPSHYGVTLQISDGEKQMDLPVSINHPAQYKGWRFYLTSYDQMRRSYVVLSARNDPGRSTVIAGIWIVMIGTFIVGFRRQAGRLRYVSQASSLPLENGEEDAS